MNRRAAISLTAMSVLLLGGAMPANAGRDPIQPPQPEPLIGATGPVVETQAESYAAHPLVGAWLVDAKPSVPGINLHTSVFNADGTTSDSSPGSSGRGVWVPTSENTADVSFVEVVSSDDGHEATVMINTSLEVSEDGASWTGMHTVHFSPEMAELFGTPNGEYGPMAVSATRIVLEPMDPVGPMPGE